MSWSVVASGTSTPAVGTPVTLASSAASGTFVFQIDGSNLQAGEYAEVSVLVKTLSTSGLNRVWKTGLQGPLVNPVVQFPPVVSDQDIAVSLDLISAGASRSFDWKLLSM